MQYVMTPFSTKIEFLAWWDGGFNENELNWLQQSAKSSAEEAQVGSGHHGAVNTQIRRSRVSWLNNNQETNWVFIKLGNIAARLNAENFRFNLTGLGEALQLTNYDEKDNGMYGWHVDYGEGISRKLSLVLQLTDPSEYEGGNLQVMTEGAEPVNIPKRRGLLSAFPSYALHRVTPVTSGSRQTLVTWVSGPPFK